METLQFAFCLFLKQYKVNLWKAHNPPHPPLPYLLANVKLKQFLDLSLSAINYL